MDISLTWGALRIRALLFKVDIRPLNSGPSNIQLGGKVDRLHLRSIDFFKRKSWLVSFAVSMLGLFRKHHALVCG